MTIPVRYEDRRVASIEELPSKSFLPGGGPLLPAVRDAIRRLCIAVMRNAERDTA